MVRAKLLRNINALSEMSVFSHLFLTISCELEEDIALGLAWIPSGASDGTVCSLSNDFFHDLLSSRAYFCINHVNERLFALANRTKILNRCVCLSW
jgi:hypothetical protein